MVMLMHGDVNVDGDGGSDADHVDGGDVVGSSLMVMTVVMIIDDNHGDVHDCNISCPLHVSIHM